MTEISRSRASGRYRSTTARSSYRNASSRAASRSSAAVGEGHPDGRAEPRRLDHQPRVGRRAGERLELAEHGGPARCPRGGPNLQPVDDREAEPAPDALLRRLVHAEGRGQHAGAGVRQPGRLEQRLDRAVLAERAVQRDEHERLRRRRREAIDRGSNRVRAIAAERRTGRRTRRPVDRRAGGRPAATTTPPSRSMRTCRTSSPASRSASAIAVPDTIETSCSADGPPRRTAIGG